MDAREAAVLLQGLASRKHLLQDTARRVLTGDLDDILCEEQRERAALYAAARDAYEWAHNGLVTGYGQTDHLLSVRSRLVQ